MKREGGGDEGRIVQKGMGELILFFYISKSKSEVNKLD
jgi:hypothetical protein